MKIDTFESTNPEVVKVLLTIASFPGGVAYLTFGDKTYEVTIKHIDK